MGQDRQAHGEEHMTNTVALDDGLTRVLMSSRTTGRDAEVGEAHVFHSFHVQLLLEVM